MNYVLSTFACLYRFVSSPFNHFKRRVFLSLLSSRYVLNRPGYYKDCYKELVTEHKLDNPNCILEQVTVLLLIIHRRETGVNYLTNIRVKQVLLASINRLFYHFDSDYDLDNDGSGYKLVKEAIDDLIIGGDITSMTLSRHREAYIKRATEVLHPLYLRVGSDEHLPIARFIWWLKH